MPRFHNINGNVVQFTAEEETARDNEETAVANAAPARALTELRRKRDSLLKACDWEIMQELEKGNAISDEMKTYRQALRDLPNGKDTVAKCTNATWPTKP
jgi:gamma-glutamylcysteine synthetase